MSNKLIADLMSFRSRLVADTRSQVMFEGDFDTIDQAISALRDSERLRAIIEQDNVEPVAESCSTAFEGYIPKFKRESRYLVIKLKRISKSSETWLRQQYSDALVDCVVIESDWPEYERVWGMLQNRMTGAVETPPKDSTEPASKDWVMVPREPNKTQFIGEFSIDVKHHCSACGFHGAQDDCEVCGGEVEYTQKHTIPWTTFKEIYKAITAAPTTPKGE